MDKNFAWELFKNTGNIDAYLLMKDVESDEQMKNQSGVIQSVLGDNNGINKNEGDSYKNS